VQNRTKTSRLDVSTIDENKEYFVMDINEGQIEQWLNQLAQQNEDTAARIAAGKALREAAKMLGTSDNANAIPILQNIIERSAALFETQLDGVGVAEVPIGIVEALAACDTLGMKGEEGRLTLLSLFHSQSLGVRWVVSLIAGTLVDIRFVEPFIAALSDGSSAIRKNAAQSLGQLKDERAINPLFRSLADNRIEVSEAAGKALVNFGESGLEALISASDDMENRRRWMAVRTIGELESVRFRDLFRAKLADPDKEVRYASGIALGRLGEEGFSTLIDALKHEQSIVRAEAAHALGWKHVVDAVVPLIEALHDLSVMVRKNAAIALGFIADLRAVDPLISLLKDAVPEVHAEAASALSKFDDLRILEPLIAYVNDLENTNSITRYHVAEAFGKLKDKRAIDALLIPLNDARPLTQWMAANSLRKIGSLKAIEAAQQWQEEQNQ
jgi:HEAT repeat protein